METRILVATDGSDAALGALRLASALAERQGGTVEVAVVVEPFPAIRSPVGELVGMTPRELEVAAVQAAREVVGDQLAALRLDAAWPITAELGSPAPSIVRLAQATHASLIVLGLGRHALADRLFGSETALRVMRLAHVPVLAVPADARELPRSAVVAVDFSDFSCDAARTAAEILAPGGQLHLAHVFGRSSPEAPWVGGTEWTDAYHASVELQLAELAREFAGAADLRVETHFLAGEPAREVLRLAQQVGADLIAGGSHGTGFFGRILMGSVSTRLVRGATCAVLIVPPREVPAELEHAWRRSEESSTPATGEDIGTGT
jgi:nucleotide-binding universal stress UspA family protein